MKTFAEFRELTIIQRVAEIEKLVKEINETQAKECLLSVTYFRDDDFTLWFYGRPYNPTNFITSTELYCYLLGFKGGWNSYEP